MRMREEYEDKFLEVQRKSEEIILYYRGELQRLSTPDQPPHKFVDQGSAASCFAL